MEKRQLLISGAPKLPLLSCLKSPPLVFLAVPIPAAPLSVLPTLFLQETHTKSLHATVRAVFSGSRFNFDWKQINKTVSLINSCQKGLLIG